MSDVVWRWLRGAVFALIVFGITMATRFSSDDWKK